MYSAHITEGLAVKVSDTRNALALGDECCSDLQS